MTERIAQLVDSAGNLPRELFEKYTIKEIPLYFSFDNEHYYRENVDYKNCDFYLHMKQEPGQIPRTSAPNIYDWLEGFREMYTQGYNKLIVTTIASRLSASYHNALQARDILLESIKDVSIEIFESRTCACGQAALEIKIAQMINSHKLSWEQITKRTSQLIPKAVSLFTVQELTYMLAGGRIGGAAAMIGKLVNIKPVCEFINGAVHPIKAVRSRKKALEYLVNTCVNRIKNVRDTVIITQHAICEEDEKFVNERLREKLGEDIHIFKSSVGTSVGSHSGPGAIGVGFISG
ncbi:MAG: DegV family protein [Syntrophomonadaceae bacterium]|jgi:DegV family protein with EDD domain